MQNIEVKFLSFSSGSCGNCYYIGGEFGGILIDAGVSLRRLKNTLLKNGLDTDSFSAILITHDHLDHIRSLAKYCQKLSKPVYASELVHEALAKHTYTANIIGAYRKVLPAEEWTQIGDFKLRYFVVPHDATETVGYAIEVHGHKIVMMTDVGRVTDEAIEFASKADTLIIESNYDVDMLMSGPYTYELKMRIIQGSGHLSNDECASALKRIWHPRLKNIFLCHLSENNNTRELAYKCNMNALEEIGVNKGSISLHCLPRQQPSQLFTL